MDRPLHDRRLPADPFARPDRQFALAEADPWGFGSEETPEGTAIPKSTQDIRDAFLKSRDEVASSAGVSVPDPSKRLTISFRLPRFPFDRRVVAGVALFGMAGALFIGLSRYDFAPSIKTVSGTTYNTAVERVASAVGAARDLVGKGPVGPVTTKGTASISETKIPNVRPTAGKQGPITFSRGLQLVAPIRTEPVEANGPAPGPAPTRNAEVKATIETKSEEAPAPLDGESALETSVIYSLDDVDVRPPVAVRTPGIATPRGNGDKYVSLIEILVSETGQVESARGRQRPGTLGAALQSNTALSVVKTWRFRPARRNGQPVKYRTTVPFIETFNPAGTTEASR